MGSTIKWKDAPDDGLPEWWHGITLGRACQSKRRSLIEIQCQGFGCQGKLGLGPTNWFYLMKQEWLSCLPEWWYGWSLCWAQQAQGIVGLFVKNRPFGFLWKLRCSSTNWFYYKWKLKTAKMALPKCWQGGSLCWTQQVKGMSRLSGKYWAFRILGKLGCSPANWFWNNIWPFQVINPYLNAGSGSPWAGHFREKVCSWSILKEPRVSELVENLGFAIPIGSEYQNCRKRSLPEWRQR